MKLFVLPSWYPSAVQPMAGLFVRDQVLALAATRESAGAGDETLVVGGWGGHDGALSLREAGTSLRALRWRLRQGGAPRWIERPGHAEVLTPRLSWSLAFGGGGAQGLLDASRRNLDAAERRFGRFDLLHAHVGFPAGWIASALRQERGLPYVLTEHMSPFPVAPLLRDGRPAPALQAAYAGAAATIAVSQGLAEAIRAQGLPCSDTVPNVVDESRFPLAPPPPAAGPRVLLSLGALRPQKGMDLLLEAFARWNPPAEDAVLWIAGDGPERGALQAQARRLGLEGTAGAAGASGTASTAGTARVRFLGAVDPQEVPALLARCHAFVLASRHETFGVALAEALMCGRPVLATRCGGPESFVDARNGLLVPPGDVPALAEGLRELAGRIGLFDAATLRVGALQRHGRAAVAARLRAVYARVLDRGGAT